MALAHLGLIDWQCLWYRLWWMRAPDSGCLFRLFAPRGVACDSRADPPRKLAVCEGLAVFLWNLLTQRLRNGTAFFCQIPVQAGHDLQAFACHAAQ